jgi:hypothetical protein
MFRQVVSTILREGVRHADSWLPIHGSRDVPTYGFERHAEPAAISVDADALGERFAAGIADQQGQWRDLFGEELATEVTRQPLAASFPDDLWARVVFAALLAARDGRPVPEIVDALEPIHFGRLASYVREATDATPDEAEALVERQAMAFEAAKPDLVRAWLRATPVRAAVETAS